MTSNNTSTSKSLESLSIATIRSLLIPQLLYLVFGTVNLLASTICIIVLFRGKQFTGRTFVFLRLFFVQDFLLTLYMLVVNSIWHLFNNLFGRSEIFPRYACFRFTGVLFCMVINNSMLTFMISIDRLRMTLKPTLGSLKFKWTPGTAFMILTPSMVSCLLYIVSLFDNADSSTIVLYCTTRSSTGPKTTLLFWYTLTSSSYATLFIYLFMLLTARCKLAQIDTSTENGNQISSVNAINIKMTRRLSKLLAYTTMAYFIIGPLPNTVSALLVSFLPADIVSLGSYIGWMTFTESSMYLVSLLFLDQFREEFLSMFIKKLSSSPTIVPTTVKHALSDNRNNIQTAVLW